MYYGLTKMEVVVSTSYHEEGCGMYDKTRLKWMTATAHSLRNFRAFPSNKIVLFTVAREEASLI